MALGGGAEQPCFSELDIYINVALAPNPGPQSHCRCFHVKQMDISMAHLFTDVFSLPEEPLYNL